jgi:predicted nucleotidyltransferase
MTMRISKGQQIGGIPAKDMRHMLRKCGGGFRADWVEDQLFRLWIRKNSFADPDWDKARRACRREAARRIKTLLQEGFIRLDEDSRASRDGSNIPSYKLTESGEALCRATAAKPVHRLNAEEVLKGFMERVRIVNEDERFLYRVTAVVVFGSYARGAQRPADIDLAIELERKISDPEEYSKARKEYVKDREFKTLSDRLWAPERDVKIFLKQRKRTLSLHDMDELVKMAKDNPEWLGNYEVLFGDKDKIAQQLKGN